MNDTDPAERIRSEVAELAGLPAHEVTDDLKLLSDGLLDSVLLVKLVDWLEGQFDVRFEPHEMSVDYLDTVPEIAKIVADKRAAGA